MEKKQKLLTPEQAEGEIILNVEEQTGAEPGSLDLMGAVEHLIREHKEKQEGKE